MPHGTRSRKNVVVLGVEYSTYEATLESNEHPDDGEGYNQRLKQGCSG